MDIFNEYLNGDIYLKHHVTQSPCDADFSMHLHDTCEIYLFMKGDIEYLVEGTVYHLYSGSVVILCPFESHRTKILSELPYERYVLNFPLSTFDSIDPERRLLRAFMTGEYGQGNHYTKDELGKISAEELFGEICYCDEDDYGRRLKIQSSLLKLLDAINTAYLKRGNASIPKSREAEMVAYVNMNLGENITVPMLAEHFYMSTSQFNRIFKVATGASPWSYITLKRLSAARERIRLGASVQNAFETSGFNDYSAFYRAYVRHFGNSPAADICKK